MQAIRRSRLNSPPQTQKVTCVLPKVTPTIPASVNRTLSRSVLKKLREQMTIAVLRHLRWEVHQSSTLQALPGRVISMISNQTATYASLLLVPRIWIWSRIPSNQRKVLVFLSPMHLLRSIRRCNLIFLNLLHQPNRNPPNMIASSRKDWPIMVSD